MMSRAPYSVIITYKNGKMEVRKKDTAQQASLEKRRAERDKGVTKVVVEISHGR